MWVRCRLAQSASEARLETVLSGLSLTWEGRQEPRFRGVQCQYPLHLQSAVLRGILGWPRLEYCRVQTGIGYTDIGVQEQEQHITKVLVIGEHFG